MLLHKKNLPKSRVPRSDDIAALKAREDQSSPEDKKVAQRILSRLREMEVEQRKYHAEWEEAEKCIEGDPDGDKDQERFRLPLERTIIERAVAEESEAFGDITFLAPDPEDRKKLPFIEAAKDDELREAGWDYQKIIAFRTRRTFGIAPCRIGHRRTARWIKQLVPDPDNPGEMKEIEVLDYLKDGAFIEVIRQPKRFLIDPIAYDIRDAEDCGLHTKMAWDTFAEWVESDPEFKNLESVRPSLATSESTSAFAGASSVGDPNTGLAPTVDVFEYWNKMLDLYVVLAGGVLIRSSRLPDDHKELPWFVFHMYRRPFTFYSMGVVKYLQAVMTPLNSVMRAEVRATKLAFPVLMTDDDASISTKAIKAYPGLTIKGGKNKAELQALGSVPAEAYKLKDELKEMAATLSGVQYNNLYETTSDRIGIEALKKESMIAMINSNLRENEPQLVRMGDLLLRNIMQYTSLAKLRRMRPEEKIEDFVPGETLFFDENSVPVVAEYKKIRLPQSLRVKEQSTEDGRKIIAEADGDGYVLARPEYIRTKAKLLIHAVRPSAMGSSKETKKLTLQEMLRTAIETNRAKMEQDQLMGLEPTPIWELSDFCVSLAEVHELPKEKVIYKYREDSGPSITDQVKSFTDPLRELAKGSEIFQSVLDRSPSPPRDAQPLQEMQ